MFGADIVVGVSLFSLIVDYLTNIRADRTRVVGVWCEVEWGVGLRMRGWLSRKSKNGSAEVLGEDGLAVQYQVVVRGIHK